MPSVVPTTSTVESIVPQTKEINTASLRQQLTALKSRLGLLVPQYNKSHGFMPVFASVVALVHEVWNRFESASCKVLVDTASDLRKAIREFNPGFLIDTYSLSIRAAEQQLCERLHTLLKGKFERDQQRLSELTKVQTDLPLLEDKLWCSRIRITGDPDGVVPRINYWAHNLTAVMLFCALCAVEGMAGYGMFEFAGSSYSAIAWSLITVIVLDLAAHFGGTSRAVINAHKDAAKIYAQKCAGGVFDIDGNPVYVTPVASSVFMMARSSEVILLLWSLGLVSFRIALALTEKDFGWNAVFGSIGMAVLALVYYSAQVRYAPKYAHDQVKEFRRLEKEINGAHNLIKKLSALPADDPYLTEREKAVKQYNEAADSAAAVVVNDTAYRRGLAGTYLALVAQYRAAYGVARTAFLGHIRQLGNLIAESSPDIDVRQFESQDRTAPITKLFDTQVIPTLVDDSLEAEATGFDPKAELPAIRLTDFAPKENEALAKVQAEAALKGSSGAMVFQF